MLKYHLIIQILYMQPLGEERESLGQLLVDQKKVVFTNLLMRVKLGEN